MFEEETVETAERNDTEESNGVTDESQTTESACVSVDEKQIKSESNTDEPQKSKRGKDGFVDMTVGKPLKIMFLFSLPLLISMAFQQIYQMADSIIVGNFDGQDALAGVGASNAVTVLFIAVASGCSIGVSVIVSQLYGLKSYSRLKSAVYTAFLTIGAIALLLTVVGLFACTPIMRALQTRGDILEDAGLYLSIYIGGLIFLFMYNAATAVYTAMGDGRTPLYFLIFSSFLNVGLDLIFVASCGMGVAGVAWATFIAQGLSGILATLVLIVRLRKIKTDEKVKVFDASLLKNMAVVAFPSICQQSFVSVGNLFLQGLVNSYDNVTPGVLAGYSAAFRVNVFAVSGFSTMSGALSSFVGQNVGAGRYDRAVSGMRSALIISAVFGAVFMALYIFLGKQITGLFLNAGEGGEVVLSTGRAFLFWVAIGYPFVMTKVVVDGLLRGAGDMLAFMITTFIDLALRVGLSFALAPALGFTGLCVAFPIGWAISMVLSLCFYRFGKWRKKRKV